MFHQIGYLRAIVANAKIISWVTAEIAKEGVERRLDIESTLAVLEDQLIKIEQQLLELKDRLARLEERPVTFTHAPPETDRG